LLSLDECAELLSDFALTHNQARIYIAIVQLGIATVSQVSKVSKVRREEVYRMLPKLEKLGLIERILDRPTRVKATPIEEALSILIKREQEMARKRVSTLKAEKEALLKSFQLINRKPESGEKAHFSLISRREAIIRKELAMITNAERAIDIITSRDEFNHFFTNYSDEIKEVISKGVKVCIVLHIAEHDDSIRWITQEYRSSKAPVALKYTGQPVFHYAIVDYKEALVATSIEPTALGKNPYLWTDDSNLIELLQKKFESMWHTSVNIEAIETEAIAEKLIRFLGDLRPTNHVLLLYGSPEAKYNVLLNYFQIGLENGEAAVYVTTEKNLSQIRKTMKQHGINVEKNEKTGALCILRYNEFYIMKGKFSISATLGLIRKMYNEALAKGFKGFRIFGDMACFFEHNLARELIEYEKALHRVLDLPIIGICAYNSNILTNANNPLDLYNELLRAHGTVLFSGLDTKMGRIEIRQA
jgi:sugar-specific transcriptional regulator TrmB